VPKFELGSGRWKAAWWVIHGARSVIPLEAPFFEELLLEVGASAIPG
jgi:hypothetical protein